MTIRGISILTLTILYLPIAAAQQVTSPDVMLYEHPENQWFEAPSGRVNVSDDAQWAIFSGAQSFGSSHLPQGPKTRRA